MLFRSVPVRETVAGDSAASIETPAVIAGRVWAIAPDHARIRAYDAADGSFLDEIPTGADGAIGAPSYLVGDESSGLVVAVGDRIACFAAASPRETLWSRPGPDGAPAERIRGRVQFAATDAPKSPVVLVPQVKDLAVLDARTGTERMRVAGAGSVNGILAGNQLLAGTGSDEGLTASLVTAMRNPGLALMFADLHGEGLTGLKPALLLYVLTTLLLSAPLISAWRRPAG